MMLSKQLEESENENGKVAEHTNHVEIASWARILFSGNSIVKGHVDNSAQCI